MTGFDPDDHPGRSPDGRRAADTGSGGEGPPEVSIRWESDSGVWWTTPEGDPLAPAGPRPADPNAESPTPVDAPAEGKRRRPALIAVVAVGAVAVVLLGVGVVRQSLVVGSPTTFGRRTSPGETSPTQSAPPTTTPTSAIGPSKPDFSASLAATQGSVARVIASTCEGSGSGTGFLIGPDQVVASYPSVAQSVATVVQVGDEVIPGTLIGADPSTGVALIELTRDAPGRPLTIASANAAPGMEVLTVGLPFRSDEVTGEASTLGASGSSVAYREIDISGLSSLAGDNDRGLSGAPVVTAAGEVVGATLALPSTAGRWMVGAEQLTAGIERARSQPATAATCDKPTGPHSDTRIKGEVSSKLKKGLVGYFSGINKGDEAAAWRNMGPAYHRDGYSLRSFDWTSTYDFDITVHRTWTSGGQRRAWVSFVAINDPARAPKGLEGEWCARWSFDYELSDGGDRYLVNGNPGHDGAETKMERC